MLTRNQKEEIVKQLTEEIKASKSIVFTGYKGVGVKDMSLLRKKLRQEGAKLQVLKKHLVSIALKKADIDLDAKKLEGQLAVAISKEDEVSPAKIINDFAKVNENVKILGGILGIKKLSVEEVKALALLPSKEQLLSSLVRTLQAPISGFVRVLQGNQQGLVQVLKAISEKK